MTEIGSVSIHHVAVQTRDLDRALAFYVGVLGATLLERRQFKKRQLAWLSFGEVRIELFSARTGEELTAWDDFFPGPVHIAFLVNDLDQIIEHAQRLGVSLHPSHPEPFVPPVAGVGRIAYLLGPDGEEVEIRTS